MKAYLTQDEISSYCGLISGVKMEHVEAASVLIDAYKGCSFYPVEHTEHVNLIHKRVKDMYRGKLRHFPRVEIKKITARVPSVFGAQIVTFDNDCLIFDEDASKYFTFDMPRQFLFQGIPMAIDVTYTSGYSEVPEAIKRACGLLASNIKQMGGTLPWQSRDDYDVKVTLADTGVFSPEIKNILRGVEVE